MKAGKKISHYRVLERLGGGGMGEVFKAEDLRLERRVALKFLPSELGEDPVAKRRFMQEAKTASALDHQNICTLYEIDQTEEGRLFLAMAFYDGETLKKRLAAGPLPVDEALEITEQVAEGLAKAHGEGIVHRDIKPANLMVTRDGVVKIVDFGLAKLAGDPGLTKTGTSVGTPVYMSPEQARGEEVDHRTDLWSLGVVLYEMLTGRPPFGGASQGEILHAILYEDPEPLSTLRPGLPPLVERLVDRLLTRDLHQRLSTAREAAESLRKARHRTSVAAEENTAAPTMAWPGTASVEERESTGSRQRRSIVAGAVALLVLVAGVVVWWWVGEPRDAPPPGPPTEASEVTDTGPGNATSAAMERKRIVVLPFQNLGPPEHEYFAAGMTEEITSRLARVGDLGVIARTSAVQYKATDKSIPEIAEELHVDYLLEGTVRWAPAGEGPGRVRITPQLVRASDQTHLWADAYDATLEDIFTVQSDIARQVTDELQVMLSRSERRAVGRRPTENLKAYQAYLRGLHHQERAAAGAEAAKATAASFEHAVELDPGFALAWARVGQALSSLYNHGYDRSPEICLRSREAAERALELTPSLPDAHLALAYYHYWCERDYEPALDALETARGRLPNNSEVMALQGFIQRRQGRWEQSMENLERAMQLDPRSALLPDQLATTHLLLGEYEAAIRLADQAIAIDPDYANPYIWKASARFALGGEPLEAEEVLREAKKPTGPTLSRRALWLHVAERNEDALRLLDSLGSPDSRFFYLSNIHLPVTLIRGEIFQAMDRDSEARTSYGEALEILKEEREKRHDDPQLHVGLALTYAGLDDRDRAIGHAERAVEMMPVSRDALIGEGYVEILAETYARVGEVEAGCETIDRYLSIPSEFDIHWFERHPAFAPLRDEPCFEKIRTKHSSPGRGHA